MLRHAITLSGFVLFTLISTGCVRKNVLVIDNESRPIANASVSYLDTVIHTDERGKTTWRPSSLNRKPTPKVSIDHPKYIMQQFSSDKVPAVISLRRISELGGTQTEVFIKNADIKPITNSLTRNNMHILTTNTNTHAIISEKGTVIKYIVISNDATSVYDGYNNLIFMDQLDGNRVTRTHPDGSQTITDFSDIYGPTLPAVNYDDHRKINAGLLDLIEGLAR